MGLAVGAENAVEDESPLRGRPGSGPRGGGAPAVKRQPIVLGEKIGRNDPCPCGSGKKYKKCHGA